MCIFHVVRHFSYITSLALVLWISVSCRPESEQEVMESRPRREADSLPAKVDVSYDRSFPNSEQYRWKKPTAWTRQPKSQFRDLNFSFGPQREGECYLSLVNGGELENINRWCQQMAAPSYTPEQIAALPQKPIFGRQGRFVDLTGTFGGMAGAGAEGKTNYRLLGLVVAGGDVTLTVKMTGPAELVAQQLVAFDEFTSSLTFTPAPPR
jgi:hypothetical protein